MGLPYPDPQPRTLILKRDYDEKTKYWGTQAKLKELLSVGCGSSLYPRVGAIYSLEKVNVKQLLQISPGVDPIDRVQLRSAKGVDYRRLRDLLRARQWQMANRETSTVMLKAAQQNGQSYLDRDDVKRLPCQDLHTIDQLWSVASYGRFGFTVQKRIWQQCGSPMMPKNWEAFADLVGWRKDGDVEDLDGFIYDLFTSPEGQLPWVEIKNGRLMHPGVYVKDEGVGFCFLAQELVKCSKSHS